MYTGLHNLKSYTARRIINAKTLILIENGRIIDKNMKKSDLKEKAGISSASLAKLGKGDNITTDVLLRICEVMDCRIEDILETVRD